MGKHFRQAITTKYLGPTNARGSRVKATAEAGSLTIGWDCELDAADNHAKAAQAFAEKFGWDGQWIGGGTKDGYVFCNVTADAVVAVATYGPGLVIRRGDRVYTKDRETRTGTIAAIWRDGTVAVKWDSDGDSSNHRGSELVRE